MKCNYIESLYTKYKDQIIITKKSFDEWIATVNKNFPIKKVEITDSIINTFQLIENSTFDLNDWTIYLLEEETNTKIYYDFNRQRFVGNSPIYIFISNKKIEFLLIASYSNIKSIYYEELPQKILLIKQQIIRTI